MFLKNILIKMYSILWNLKMRVFQLLNIKTLGARALVIKGNQILLVEHTYIEGFYTVGGGVDPNETPLQALIRELKEEVNLTVTKDPEFFGVYLNKSHGNDDYVFIYVVKDFIENEYITNDEIKTIKWFDINNLPKEVTESTLKRINEYLGINKKSEHW